LHENNSPSCHREHAENRKWRSVTDPIHRLDVGNCKPATCNLQPAKLTSRIVTTRRAMTKITSLEKCQFIYVLEGIKQGLKAQDQ
jgi:hypothetical protein